MHARFLLNAGVFSGDRNKCKNNKNNIARLSLERKKAMQRMFDHVAKKRKKEKREEIRERKK